MAPFVGLPKERQALAAFLSQVAPWRERSLHEVTGPDLFQQNCAVCHLPKSQDPMVTFLTEFDQETIAVFMEDLSAVNESMPELNLTENERALLARWFNETFKETN